jgi:hypothetical protein
VNDALWIEETSRLYTRYQLELVEALNLCPWAKRARQAGQVELKVALQAGDDPAPSLRQISEWAARGDLEIGLLIFPRIGLGRRDFERFVAGLVKADADRLGLQSPTFALAAFHPDASADMGTPERLVPYWRRTPDPTIQLVLMSALERVRQGDVGGTGYFDMSQLDLSDPKSAAKFFAPARESLRERVASANLKTLQAQGQEAVEARFAEILQDHQQTRLMLEQAAARER